ncbi:MAG: creatininase family protein [Candidatus Latescibacteria bacterium]|nr:creatininase family protein [Candidatus Latescibacterota bacterium]
MSDQNSRRKFLKALGTSGIAATTVSGKAAAAELGTGDKQTSLNSVNVSDINPKKVLLNELTRKEVREWIASGELKAAIIPTGSTEQHNEHMALSMDTEASLVISQLTALKLYPKVIVTTPVAFGICPFFMKRQGTITIREEIFTGLVYDICCSMKTHGINTILIVNGHGGNSRALRSSVADFSSKLGIPIDACSYWDSVSREQRREFTETGSIPGHADEFETSFALAAFPERIRRVTYNESEQYTWEPAKEDLDRVGYFDAKWFSREFDKSSFDESLLATAEKGERFIPHAVEWVSAKLLNMMG